MRTTIEVPEKLLRQAMQITQSKAKSETIRKALEWIIDHDRRLKLPNFKGKVDLIVDLDNLRDRA